MPALLKAGIASDSHYGRDGDLRQKAPIPALSHNPRIRHSQATDNRSSAHLGLLAATLFYLPCRTPIHLGSTRAHMSDLTGRTRRHPIRPPAIKQPDPGRFLPQLSQPCTRLLSDETLIQNY